MKKIVYAILNNLLSIFPPFGLFLKVRGVLSSLVLKKCGQNLKVSSFVNIYNPQRVSMGHNVYIGYCTYLGNGDITLADEVIIGPFCVLSAGNHSIKNGSYRFGEYQYGSISIGKGTWLGAHCVVTSNVKIGQGCLIAAGSVVTKDVNDFSIVGGVPAKELVLPK
jgi:maltose O-acetyltransferase